MPPSTRAAALLLCLMASPLPAQTVLEEIAETGRFDRFVDGVTGAGLADRLNAAEALTIFAPTDEAYERYTPESLEAAFHDDVALVRRLLLSHVVEGERRAAENLPRTLPAASGETITVLWRDGDLRARIDGEPDWPRAPVIRGGEVRTPAAIVHPLDGLLLPQDVTLEAVDDHAPDLRVESDVEEAPEALGASAEAVEGPGTFDGSAALDEPEDATPVPAGEGAYLDEVMDDADVEAMLAAPAEDMETDDDAAEVAPDDGGEPAVTVHEGRGLDRLEIDPEDDPEPEAVPVVEPDESSRLEEDGARAGRRAAAAGARAAESAAEAVPGATSRSGANVVVEEMNVVVEQAPQVAPRTVAPSVMMGPAPGAEGASSGGSASAADGGSGDVSPDGSRGDEAAALTTGPAQEADDAFVADTVEGWTVVGPEGGEIGSVEHVVVSQEDGRVEGVLVEVGAVLGLVGGRLIRLNWDEVEVEADDEVLVADITPGDADGRPTVDSYELDP